MNSKTHSAIQAALLTTATWSLCALPGVARGAAQDVETQGPIAESWTQHWSLPVGKQEQGRAVVDDGVHAWSTGTSFVTTFSQGQAPVRCLRLSDGVERWTTLVDQDTYTESLDQLQLAPDAAVVYGAGESRSILTNETATLFCALNGSSGEVLWIQRWDAPYGDVDDVRDLAIAPDGQTLYATGRSSSSSFGGALFVVALDAASGDVLWSVIDKPTTANTHSAHGEGVAIAPDGSRVYVGGAWHLQGSSVDLDVHARAHDAQSGALLWSTTLDTSSLDISGKRAVHLDAQGARLYLGARHLQGATAFALDASNGQLDWSLDLGNDTKDFASSADGSVVWALSDANGAGTGDVRLSRIDAASGGLVWSQTFDAPGFDDRAQQLELGPGELALYGRLHSAAPGAQERWLVLWEAASGAEQLRAPVGSGAEPQLAAMSVAPNGSPVTFAGTTPSGGGDDDLWTLALDAAAAGAPLWDDRWGVEGAGPNQILDARFAAEDGGLLAAGFAGQSSSTGQPRALLYAQAPGGGEPLWVFHADGALPSRFTSLGTSPEGALVYAAGALGEELWLQAREQQTGVLVWEQTWSALGPALAQRLSVAPDGSRLYVAGQLQNPSGYQDVFALALDATSGNPLWADAGGGVLWNDSAVDLLSDDERVYLLRTRNSAATGEDTEVVAYQAATGAVQWSDRYDTPNASGFPVHDRATGLALAPDGARLFVLNAQIETLFGQGVGARLRALAPGTGGALWSAFSNVFSGTYVRLTRPLVAPDGARVYVGATDVDFFGPPFEYALAFEAQNGLLAWWSQSAALEAAAEEQRLAIDPSGSELVHLTVIDRTSDTDFNQELHVTGYAAADGAPRFDAFGAVDVEAERADALAWSADGRSVLFAGSAIGAEGEPQLRSTQLTLDNFVADVESVSLASGGTQTLEILAGLPHAGEHVLVLGSATGTTPGIPLGAGLVLPLTFDAYTSLFFLDVNATPVEGAFGLLDAAGRATARVVAPPGSDPSLVGGVLYHAYVSLFFGTPTTVSQPLPLLLLP